MLALERNRMGIHLHRGTRRLLAVGTVLAVVALGAGCAPDQSGSAPGDVIRIGTLGLSSDAGLFIANDLGYFADRGLRVEFEKFSTATDMIPLLGQGELDAGAGGVSASLFNAVGRGIGLRMVADKGSNQPGYGYPFVVRTSLAGDVRSPADLAGRRVLVAAKGTSPEVTAAKALENAHGDYGSVKPVQLNFPQALPAFENDQLDAGTLAEPFATQGIQDGTLELLARTDELYPNQQIAVLMYGESFIERRGDEAERFMAAYIEGLRFYNRALAGGHLTGETSDEVIKILSANTPLQDAAVWRRITAQATDPDGRMDMPSLQYSLDFWRAQGYIDHAVRLSDVVDTRFVDRALEELDE
jgi:NitT/TauT family transport system substrate-binding protein